jgi:glutathione-regulated potassium-efflux system protein KefB
VLVCVDKPEDGTRIVELMKAEFPLVPVLARASDRRHSMDLTRAGADFHIRETFESAIILGAKALETLGVAPAEVADISARVRERDHQRLQVELANGLQAGKALFRGNAGP